VASQLRRSRSGLSSHAPFRVPIMSMGPSSRCRISRGEPNLLGAGNVERPVNDARPVVAPASVAGFDEVFQAHYPALVRALTAASGDAEVAADSVQEAFL